MAEQQQEGGESTETKNEMICYNCGGTGHRARECPSMKGSAQLESLPECHACKGKGHFARVCPTSRREHDFQGCYSCGMMGHLSFQCPNVGAQPGRGMFMGRGRGMMGGMAPFMPPYGVQQPFYGMPFGGRGGGMGRGVGRGQCYACREYGHLARNCPKNNQQ